MVYEAKDSFGNTVEKMITVYIVDTEVRVSPAIRYIRFISAGFYKDVDGNLLASSQGGLEESSVWRTDDTYRSLLETSMNAEKINEEYRVIEYFGSSTEIKIAGSGEWNTEVSTWHFTKADLEEIEGFVDTHGYGNILEADALELFLELFSRCKIK